MTYLSHSHSIKETLPLALRHELETVGIKGNNKYTENKLRKEQGLNKRIAY